MIRIKPQLQSSQKRVAQFRKSVRFWASLVCITGAIFHTGIISLNYLKHPLGANLEMRTINTFILPSISICYDYLIPDLNYNDHPTYSISESSLTIKQINDGLIKWEDLIIFCRVLDSNYYQVDCDSLIDDNRDESDNTNSIVFEQLSHYSKCFTLFNGFNKTISYDRASVGDSPLVDVRLNTFNLSLGKHLSLIMMAPFDELDESINNPSLIQFDAVNSNQATVTFSSIFIYQFESKFYRTCFSYLTEGAQKYGCRSAQACISRCITESIFNKTGTSHHRRFTKITGRYSNARLSLVNDSEFVRKCVAKYPFEPCLFHRYQPLLTSQYMSPYRRNDVFQVSILYPESIDVIIRYNLSTSVTEYLIFVLSTVGLWTELSLNKIINSFLLSTYSCYKQTWLVLTQITCSLGKFKPEARGKSQIKFNSKFDTEFTKPGIKPHAKHEIKSNSSEVNLGIFKPVGGRVTRKKLLSSKGLNNSFLDYYY